MGFFWGGGDRIWRTKGGSIKTQWIGKRQNNPKNSKTEKKRKNKTHKIHKRRRHHGKKEAESREWVITNTLIYPVEEKVRPPNSNTSISSILRPSIIHECFNCSAFCSLWSNLLALHIFFFSLLNCESACSLFLFVAKKHKKYFYLKDILD